jgi:glutamate synthase domain-containing protein 2
LPVSIRGTLDRQYQRHELWRHFAARSSGIVSRSGIIAGCWLDTGEGGLSPYHLEGNTDVIMQVGTANYGIRDHDGTFSPSRAKELGKVVKAFEIKLSQGAKPGKGGVLPGSKVTAEIAGIRRIPIGQDSISPNRHRDIANVDDLLDRIVMIRDLTGRPVGVKTAIGGWEFINDLCNAVLRRGLEAAPDFLIIDGGEGGSGATPQALADHMSLPIAEGLPRVVDALIESRLKQRIRVVAAGKLVTSAKATWALCAGADFVNIVRGFMFALGCIQALRCHTNTCPTGVTTHNKRLQRGLVVPEKYLRVAYYVLNMNKEIDMIAHSCGCRHARALQREHVRIVESANQSIAFNMLYTLSEDQAGTQTAGYNLGLTYVGKRGCPVSSSTAVIRPTVALLQPVRIPVHRVGCCCG